MAKESFSHMIDDLGRVLLPKELRNELGWDTGDTLSLCSVNGTVVMSIEKGDNPESDCGDYRVNDNKAHVQVH